MRNLCVLLVIILSLLIKDFSIASAQGKIVFANLEVFTGESDIYVADIDSRSNIRNIRNLTRHPAMDNYPAWSPDFKKIAFVSDRVGYLAIHIMDHDGKNVRILTKEIKGNMDWPGWSPDGQKIAFSSEAGLYIIDVDGNNLRKIEHVTGVTRWSPDGKKIAVLNYGDIYIIDVDTGDKKIIAHGDGIDWSKRGLAYASSLQGAIFIVTPDGVILEKYPLPDFFQFVNISYSPDANRIIFNGSKKMGEWSFYVLDLKTGKVKDTEISGQRPDWGRDYYIALEPRNLLPTIWSSIKKGNNR